MTSFFSRLAASFTPSFLHRYKDVTVGQSVLYYFLSWCIVIVLGTLGALCMIWHFSSSDRVSPWLWKIPPFELQFQDNVLVKTAFPTDPYIYSLDDAHVFVSTKLSDIPSEYEDVSGFYILHDGFIVNQLQNASQKMTKVKYSDMEIGTKTINNAFINQKFLTTYPQIRKSIVPFFIPVFFIAGSCIALFFFLCSFFWSLVVFLVSKISSRPHLTYEQSIVFVLHVFFPVLLLLAAFLLSGMYFIFLPSLLFIAMFLFNILGSPTWHSRSTHKK